MRYRQCTAVILPLDGETRSSMQGRRRSSQQQQQDIMEEPDIADKNGRDGLRIHRKAVPALEWDSEGEVTVVQAGNIMLERAQKRAEREQVSQSSGSRALLLPSPSLIQERFFRGRCLESSQKRDSQSEERERNVEVYAWQDEVEDRQKEEEEQSLEELNERISPTVPSHVVTSTTAASTFQDINRSLQWSRKLPHGRHLSRAKSRTTIRSFNEVDRSSELSTDCNLTEARAGLRLLAKKREDVLVEPAAQNNRIATWNAFKVSLFLSVALVFAVGLLGLVVSLLTWASAWEGAQQNFSAILRPWTDAIIIYLARTLSVMTVAAGLCLATSMVGLSGTMLNSRPILALYAFLLWPSLLAILVVGYTSYKRANLRLDLKLNQAWSRYMDDLGRLRVQEILHCCGYYSPLHQATFSRHCYPRTTLPGCKGPLYRFEKSNLSQAYRVTFSIVLVQLGAIAASVLCSNQVNVTFGKGLTPKAYRLDMGHVRRNAVNIIQMLSMEKLDTAAARQYLEVDGPL